MSDGIENAVKFLCTSGKETRNVERKIVLTMTPGQFEELNEVD